VARPEDETYARRLAVVVIAVLEPEATAEAAHTLERASASVVDTLRTAGGDAEALAADRIVGAFDVPIGAVEAGLRAQVRIAGDVGLHGIAIRIGVHAADVVTSDEGRALRDAITVATGLASRAPPGAAYVSLAIAHAVDGAAGVAVRDLGAPSAGEPHAYLVLARQPLRRWPRRQMVGGIAAAVVLAGAMGLVVLERPQVHQPGITLGVMPFKSAGDAAAHTGLRAALRDGLNTQLSLLEGVKVYSREFLDFLVTHEGLSDYEAASRLGIRKVLSGTVTAKGDDVRVEVQIVDMGTGTLDSSFVVIGSNDALVALESDVARGVIDRLGLALTGTDTHRLESFRATDLDTYRRFLATEGEAAPGVPTPAPTPTPARPEGSSSWLLPRVAWADEVPGRDDVMGFLERYRTAIEGRDLETLARLYVEFPPEQRAALVRYFKDSTDLRVKLEDVDVAIAGDEAIVSYTRKDDFVDATTGRPMHVSGRVTKLLRRADGRWQLAPGR
jgi:TolB-like protein/ketosteroid isomerase-like protein